MGPTPPRAAKPTKNIFDAFNSSSTGHQRAENRLSGSTLWRDSRHTKLREQFNSGLGGGKRVADTVGAGSDGAAKNMGLLENGTVTWRRDEDQMTLQQSMKVEDDNVERPNKRRKLDEATTVFAKDVDIKSTPRPVVKDKAEPHDSSPSDFLSPIDPNTSIFTPPSTLTEQKPESTVKSPPEPPQIFKNLTIYINGSTAPAVSDHKLKHLLSSHGAHISIALGRRTVTHVIIGRPGSGRESGGNGHGGGGLSGSKFHKEITAKGGEKVQYVTVDWVLESVKAGKRLPESRFEALRLAPRGVGRIDGMFGKSKVGAEAGARKDGKG